MHRPSLPDVQSVNVNHRASCRAAVSRCFRENFRKKYVKNLFLSLISFGAYPYKKYKQTRRSVSQALAARRLFYFRTFQGQIETIRKEECRRDPRQSLHAIFMKIQSEKTNDNENALEFKAIYSPSEIMLFITNPVRDQKSLKLYRMRSHRLDYQRMWHEIKKKSRTNQYRQIQNINFCNRTLRKEFDLTPQEIHDRLTRTSMYRNHSHLLTRFKELSKAFQEIVLAYQDFEELSESNPELFYFLENLSKRSKKDIEILQTYLTRHYFPSDLPLENRRQLIQLGNQQEILLSIEGQGHLNLCCLILNDYQWDFFLSLQKVSQGTLSLLDWAFEESSRAMKKPVSFLETVWENTEKKVKDHPDNFPTLSEKIREDATLELMTIDFGLELNREWPSFHLFDKKELLFQLDKRDSLSQEHLIECYHALRRFSQSDDRLFMLLQQAISQVGKNSFQAAIEKGVIELLGEKSEYFLPVLANTNVTIKREDCENIEIHYTFEQIIVKKGEVQHPFEQEKYMVIQQPLKHKESNWISLEPQISIFVKKGET